MSARNQIAPNRGHAICSGFPRADNRRGHPPLAHNQRLENRL